MKKVVSLCAAGAVTCALALGAVGCGGADEKYRLYSDPMLTIEASALDDMVDISDMLFGLFLEDINYASYALDDNLVANGNFEALGDRPNANNFGQNWRAYGGGTMSIGSEDGLFADHEAYHNDELETDVNPHYAVVSVSTAGGGIINEGYKQIPIAMQKGAKYKFSAFIKSPKKSAEMTVKVDDGTKSYLEETIQLSKSNEWIKYERTVEGLDTGTKGLVLKLSFDTAGEYLVDAVSLETTDSTVGVKNYIYNAIKDMTPKFMRFPGGCIIEGDAGNGGADTKEIYDWKNSVGAVQTGRNAGDDTIPAFTYQLNTDGATKEVTTYGEWATRTNNYDLWGYNMDYGLGFYDYFLLCESIGASPVPIVNCGYSDQGGAASGAALILNGRHGQKVEDYVQDALNLIEFANGATSTKWGKLREKMGHPEPFGMKYIGIGNEQFFQTYIDCYEQFLVAFKAAQKEHPEIYGGVQPIVGNGLVFSDCEYAPNSANLANVAAKAYMNRGGIEKISEYGVVDHHYYMGYTDFFHFAAPEHCIYDMYSRDETMGYKVFVGEYSANGATRYFGASAQYQTNGFMSALSEAAYMTGLERNGDVVDLAAYAPMFGAANVNSGNRDDAVNQWDVDMMYYTNTDLLLSPNYYVQKLFMNHSGTHYLPADYTVQNGYLNEFTADGLKQDAVYQAITYDEASGDVIVKIVNAGAEDVEINVDLADTAVEGVADVTVITGKYDALSVNRLKDNGYEVLPQDFTLGVKSQFGYLAPKCSVTAIRLHTK